MDRMPWIRFYIPFFTAALASQLATSPCLAQQPVRFAGNETAAPTVRIATRSGVGYATESLGWSTADAGDTLISSAATNASHGCDACDAYQAPGCGCDGYTGCNDCNSCCDDTCCCGPWTARVNAVFMKRDSLDNIPLVTDNFGGGAEVLNANQFNFDYETGIDTSIIYDPCCASFGLEFRYLGINDWTDARSATGLSNAGINTNPFNDQFGSTLDASYRSEFQSFEISARKRCRCNDCITLLAGFRYVDFSEQLDLVFDTFGENHWMTTNDLYGFQAGAEAILYDNCCGFRIEGVGKAGIYGNNAKVNTMIQAVEVGTFTESSGMDHLAFMGELGLMASYEFCPCWRVRAGYQVMFLEGVLVAANQVPMSNAIGMAQGFDYSGVLYHGATVGLEGSW